MKALIPSYCRPMGYIILFISLFLPFLLLMWGIINDQNLIFYKECTKLLMMTGALMILLAISKNESPQTEKIRINAMRNAIYLTFLFIFFGMLYRVAIGDVQNADSSSFVVFMILNVICLEYGMKKEMIKKVFKG